jgi:hypothetical protein
MDFMAFPSRAHMDLYARCMMVPFGRNAAGVRGIRARLRRCG